MTCDRDQPRPFFGEQSEPVGAVPPRDLAGARRGTVDQLRQWRVDEGLCPRACSGELDGEGCCPKCGWSLVEEQARDSLRRREQPVEDWLPTLPAALFFDEYGPANLDAA